ncbi:hypothetical protein, partial [Streptosporangium sp. NPDC006007]|uniref:hypothetical protein n=1 Tax=Streptosporangium sp. NPDC006007 TaxID=3154575 RepID=UPI0033A9A59E
SRALIERDQHHPTGSSALHVNPVIVSGHSTRRRRGGRRRTGDTTQHQAMRYKISHALVSDLRHDQVSDLELDWLLARIPERERRKLEQVREEERARYRWRLEQAREKYRRREEMMRRELEHDRKTSGNTDDQERGHPADDTST